jgi:hypothetical protein
VLKIFIFPKLIAGEQHIDIFLFFLVDSLKARCATHTLYLDHNLYNHLKISLHLYGIREAEAD